ncbi:MAG TPA: GNAT family N-acetyltransferase [Alphaproteobacteria bacterium]|nr:GNAT family N-acetyltransferase [Alphaproteobacteria bacterium]
MTSAAAPSAFELPAALVSQGYRLRRETEEDVPFLMRLYASTREEELAPVPWTPEQKAAFLSQQFAAQRKHYYATIEKRRFDVLEREGEPVGRLYLDATPTRIYIVDIALMPAFRAQGLGTAILEALKAEGRASGRWVGIFVEKFNPALRLYRRLGFTEVADHEVYLEMEWRPEAGAPGTQAPGTQAPEAQNPAAAKPVS